MDKILAAALIISISTLAMVGYKLHLDLVQLNTTAKNIQGLVVHKIKVDQHIQQIDLQTQTEILKELKKKF